MAQIRREKRTPIMTPSAPLPLNLPPPRDTLALMPGAFQVAMGLHPLDLAEWIDVDDRLPAELAEKRRLLCERRDEVLAVLPEAEAGARETLDLLADHLPRRYPVVYSREGTRLLNHATDETWDLDANALRPLELAARLVQEDLCLMGEGAEGAYRLTGACVCFPTRWRLAEKIGRSLGAIHAPVPHYDTQLTPAMDRLFARLPVERPVWRLNMSLVDSPALFQPGDHSALTSTDHVTAQNAGDFLWLRMERQTLRRLPSSRDVLFTIRVASQPLADLAGRPETAARLAAALAAIDVNLSAYKSIEPIRAATIAWLQQAAGQASGGL